MNKTYNVYWSQTVLDELSNILAYPPEVKECIYLDTFERLSYMPILTAKQIPNGILKDYWVRLGPYQVMLVFEISEEEGVVWIDGINIREKMFIGRKSNKITNSPLFRGFFIKDSHQK